MKFNFRIKKDTLNDYLDDLTSRANNLSLQEEYLKLMADEITQMADEVVPKMNPNLRYSGLNESFWKINEGKGKTSLTILYTGFTGEGIGAPDDISVWWEFGKYHKGGYSDILGRDYAYYQEFGVDKFAPNDKVRAARFEGHGYLSSAISNSEDIVEYWAEEYLLKILYGR